MVIRSDAKAIGDSEDFACKNLHGASVAATRPASDSKRKRCSSENAFNVVISSLVGSLGASAMGAQEGWLVLVKPSNLVGALLAKAHAKKDRKQVPGVPDYAIPSASCLFLRCLKCSLPSTYGGRHTRVCRPLFDSDVSKMHANATLEVQRKVIISSGPSRVYLRGTRAYRLGLLRSG